MDRLTIKMGDSDTRRILKKKELKIGPYTLSAPLTMLNGGFSKWGFCTRDGIEFFIKEFLSPVYPTDDSTLEKDISERKIKQCMDWFQKKKRLYLHIMRAQNGNIIAPLSLFQSNSHYYIITEKVNGYSLNDVMEELDDRSKFIILKVLADCFNRLAKENIVHADVKPDNIIIKPTIDGCFTAKVIDFDAGYLENDPPDCEEIQGDAVYFAPETFLYMMEGHLRNLFGMYLMEKIL